MSGLSDFLEKQKHINTNLTSSNSLIQGSLHSLPSRQENPLRNQSQSVFSMLLIISKLATFWVRFTKKKKEEEREGKEKRRKERSRENTTGIKRNPAAPAGGARGDPGRHVTQVCWFPVRVSLWSLSIKEIYHPGSIVPQHPLPLQQEHFTSSPLVSGTLTKS